MYTPLFCQIFMLHGALCTRMQNVKIDLLCTWYTVEFWGQENKFPSLCCYEYSNLEPPKSTDFDRQHLGAFYSKTNTNLQMC